MKVKQLTLKAFEFEIEEDAAFIEYYSKNAPLIQGHQLILKGKVSADVKAFLEDKKAVYVDLNEKTLVTRKKRSTPVLEEPISAQDFSKENVRKVNEKASVYYRPIRSGEGIESEDDLVFFGRINSGAIIECSRSVQIFGIIDGLVRSDGEYLLLKEIGQGSVFFHGEELDKSHLDGKLKLIKYEDGIVFKDV